MCGLCGLYNLDGSPADAGPALAMSARLAHRGPDDDSSWSGGPAALAFRRLSILDVAGGRQPMVSEDGRLALVFNGEIYNHPELRAELEARGARYRTRSDAETILHLYARLGTAAFARLEGMFAAALWDGGRGELVLARDPLGVKPLYYATLGPRLLFASELRALLAAGVPDALDPAAAAEFLAWGFVHAPRTALSAARKLPPGQLLRAGPQGLRVESFWEPPPPDPQALGEEEALERLEALLRRSVRAQLLSDVPLGAFLSGGVDSSLVTSFMAEASPRPVPTFSIGFSGARRGLDESAWARLASKHIGTEHHELVLPAGVLDRLEELAPCLDEPVADSAVLPTFLLARFARRSVKVVLTGEGADELFAGYGRYKAAHLAERLRGLPAWGRVLLAPLARLAGPAAAPEASLADWARGRAGGPAEEICSAALLAAARGARLPPALQAATGPLSLGGASALDLRTVLCDSLLMKVDKATMRAGLEARVPFLDKALVEFALRLPARLKMRRLKGKYLLRRLAARRLPPSVAWRRKHGFLVPWEEWVRRADNPAVDDLLSGSALSRSGIFDMERLRGLRRRLAGGEPADAGLLFKALVLGLWLESIGRRDAVGA